jgi:hypothetical protein
VISSLEPHRSDALVLIERQLKRRDVRGGATGHEAAKVKAMQEPHRLHKGLRDHTNNSAKARRM